MGRLSYNNNITIKFSVRHDLEFIEVVELIVSTENLSGCLNNETTVSASNPIYL